MVSGYAETSLSSVTTDDATKADFWEVSSVAIGTTSIVAYLSITAMAFKQSLAATSSLL